MLNITLAELNGPKGTAIIYNLMQDQPRKMSVVGIRGLYDNEIAKSQQSKKDFIAMKPSFVWEDNEQTKSKLSGTCALLVTDDYDDELYPLNLLDTIKKAAMYGDSNVFGLLVSASSTTGEDNNEAIMPDARLICVINA